MYKYLFIYASAYQSTCLSLCLPVRPSVCRCLTDSLTLSSAYKIAIYRSVNLSVYICQISIYRSVSLSVCMSLSLAIYQIFIGLSIYLSVCLPIYQISIYRSVHLSCLSISVFMSLSVCLSDIYLSICELSVCLLISYLFISLTICLSVCLCLSTYQISTYRYVHLSVCLYVICIFIDLSFYLPVCLFIYQSFVYIQFVQIHTECMFTYNLACYIIETKQFYITLNTCYNTDATCKKISNGDRRHKRSEQTTLIYHIIKCKSEPSKTK